MDSLLVATVSGRLSELMMTKPKPSLSFLLIVTSLGFVLVVDVPSEVAEKQSWVEQVLDREREKTNADNEREMPTHNWTAQQPKTDAPIYAQTLLSALMSLQNLSLIHKVRMCLQSVIQLFIIYNARWDVSTDLQSGASCYGVIHKALGQTQP
ncbi:hypothetical protein XENOCAPTIV_027532 [Xenoophorus captivus]|uniref:Uncharacterized protein n=1 Tax=Xenoophorus captivus TaxID=1517983 RepID=A0ABV0RC69_9TELE